MNKNKKFEIFKKASVCRNFELNAFNAIQKKKIRIPVYLSAGQEFISSTLSSVITDILNGGNCLSKISTLKATLSTKGTIKDNPDSKILVNLPNLSITKTLD